MSGSGRHARVPRGARPEAAEAIVDAALVLAEQGGFDHVRQREVAARAGVTLRTLYRKFPTKEEILAVGLVRAVAELDRRLARKPLRARTARGRLTRLFEEMSAVLCEKPMLARAVVRAVASGIPGTAAPALTHTQHAVGLVVGALRGEPVTSAPTAHEMETALLLLRVWFASLVGWCHGLSESMDEAMAAAIRRLVP